VSPPAFRPSIPNLVYQYDLYTNYPSEALDKLNPEIDAEAGAGGGDAAHQGLRVEFPDDKMVIPTHSGKDGEVPMYSEEEVEARLVEAMARDAEQLGIPAAAPEPEPVSPAVQAVMDRREAAGKLKKVFELITIPVESSIKARCKLAKAEEATKEAALANFEATMAKIDDLIGASASALAAELDAGEEGGKWQQVVAEVSREATAEMRTKKQLVAFTELAQRKGKECFKLTKALLAEIKALKAAERGE